MSIPYTHAACELIKLFSPTVAKTTHMCVTLTPTHAKFTAHFCGHHQIEAEFTAEECRFSLLDEIEEKHGVGKSIFYGYRDPSDMKESIRVQAEAIIEKEGENP